MKQRTAHCTSLGSHGVQYWLLQRGTSIVIISYIIFIATFLSLNANLQYEHWQQLFTHLGMQIFSSLFLISVCWHSWQGLWGVITDYIKAPALRLGALSSILLLTITYFIWGLIIIWGL